MYDINHSVLLTLLSYMNFSSGSAISMGASVLTFFEQLGLLEEFISYGKPTMYANMYNEKRELQNTIDFSFLKNV